VTSLRAVEAEALRPNVSLRAILLLDLISGDSVVASRVRNGRNLLSDGEVEAAVLVPDDGKSARRVAFAVRDAGEGAIVAVGRCVALGGDGLAVGMLNDGEVIAMHALAGS